MLPNSSASSCRQVYELSIENTSYTKKEFITLFRNVNITNFQKCSIGTNLLNNYQDGISRDRNFYEDREPRKTNFYKSNFLDDDSKCLTPLKYSSNCKIDRFCMVLYTIGMNYFISDYKKDPKYIKIPAVKLLEKIVPDEKTTHKEYDDAQIKSFVIKLAHELKWSEILGSINVENADLAPSEIAFLDSEKALYTLQDDYVYMLEKIKDKLTYSKIHISNAEEYFGSGCTFKHSWCAVGYYKHIDSLLQSNNFEKEKTKYIDKCITVGTKIVNDIFKKQEDKISAKLDNQKVSDKEVMEAIEDL